ncbi:MAG: 4-hydroxythreonine-4-phosphate dehydrogenase PdxA [Myxococcota bacterium]
MKPLAVSVGDPAGVGPEVAVQAAIECGADDRIVLFGDGERLKDMLRQKKTSCRVHALTSDSANALPLGDIGLVHVSDWSDSMVLARSPTVSGGKAQLDMLNAAIESVTQGHARALVTGPTSKRAIELAGTPFTGQTEHLARAALQPPDSVTMMFLGPRLRVALVTTHLAISSLPGSITADKVQRTVRHLSEVLSLLRIDAECGPSNLESFKSLVVEVAGLNPHAGEHGLFGSEELEVIEPALEGLRDEPLFSGPEAEVILRGPSPSESVFRAAAAGRLDGVVAMMHDQATIASKLLDWGSAVNVTWGLPFVRTSVDHGVAYEAAANGTAEADGMKAALALAQRLTLDRCPTKS